MLEWYEATKPAMQQHIAGKTIQFENGGEWEAIRFGPVWNTGTRYRVKPETKLRPYTDAELREQVGKVFVHKKTGEVFLASSYRRGFVRLSEYGDADSYALSDFNHIDGSPCGFTE